MDLGQTKIEPSRDIAGCIYPKNPHIQCGSLADKSKIEWGKEGLNEKRNENNRKYIISIFFLFIWGALNFG